MTDSLSSVSARPEILAALRQASASTGVDFGYLVRTAQRESNFDPTAKARTSSATGLFQFTSETWLNVLDRYGPKAGIAVEGTREQKLALREDPTLSAQMAGELAKENAGILRKKLGREPTTPELYAAHFMGPSEAARLVSAARRGDEGSAAAMFPRAALANANVFRDADGKSLDAAGLYVKLTGQSVQQADAGRVSANFSLPVGPALAVEAPSEPQAILAARLGVAQLTSSLMSALFDLQREQDAKKS